jgi:hypothetical protein
VRLNEENRTALDKLRQAEAERPQTPVEDAQAQQVSLTGVKLGPLPGTCPNCEKLIAMAAENYLHCGVTFGPSSSWKVRPL